VASEFCGTSITSQGPSDAAVESTLGANPHIRYGNGRDRGYVVLELNERRLEAKLRTVATVKAQEAAIATAATFHVESGKPGVQRR
jgi:alkaline phosphatase D